MQSFLAMCTLAGPVAAAAGEAGAALRGSAVDAGPASGRELSQRTYASGQNVPNLAYKAHCGEWYGDLEDAKQRCDQSPSSCAVLHDYNCDGSNWRVCWGSVEQMQEGSSDRGACTKVVEEPSTPTPECESCACRRTSSLIPGISTSIDYVARCAEACEGRGLACRWFQLTALSSNSVGCRSCFDFTSNFRTGQPGVSVYRPLH